MKIVKIAGVTATVAALALGVAACGGGATTESQPSAAASAPAASGPKFAGQTLTMWRLGDSNPPAQAYMDDLNAEFQKQTGATVKLEWIPWPQVNDKFTAAAAGGAGPDVTEIGNDQVPLWVSQEALAPITPLTSAGDQAQIPKNLFGLETIDGEVYAVPWGAGTRAVLYRKDWFEELKIEVPKTWDEVLAAAQEDPGREGQGRRRLRLQRRLRRQPPPSARWPGPRAATTPPRKATSGWAAHRPDLQGRLRDVHGPGDRRSVRQVAADPEHHGHPHPLRQRQGRHVPDRVVGHPGHRDRTPRAR